MNLRELIDFIESKRHDAAWRAFRRQPWQLPSDDTARSDPTFAAVWILENDEEYQAARRLLAALRYLKEFIQQTPERD